MRCFSIPSTFAVVIMLFSGCGNGSGTHSPTSHEAAASETIMTDLTTLVNHKAAIAQLQAYRRAGYVISGLREVDASNGDIRLFECTATRKKTPVIDTITIAIKGTRKHTREMIQVGNTVVSTTDTDSP